MNKIRLQTQKKTGQRDNNNNSWNNVMNDGKKVKSSALFPAYHNAERKLLSLMMQHREVCDDVQAELQDQFNVENHVALVAYLYAYYAQGNPENPSSFIATLADESLTRLASEIISQHSVESWNHQVINDYIREIRKFPKQKHIRQKKEEMLRAERSGDVLRAAQIGNEIITLEKELKPF